MRKVTIATVALTFLVAGFVLAQVSTAKAPAVPERTLKLFTPPPDNSRAQNPADAVKVNDDLALRIEGTHDGRVIGTLLTKVNGQWVEVQLASKNMRAVAR